MRFAKSEDCTHTRKPGRDKHGLPERVSAELVRVALGKHPTHDLQAIVRHTKPPLRSATRKAAAVLQQLAWRQQLAR